MNAMVKPRDLTKKLATQRELLKGVQSISYFSGFEPHRYDGYQERHKFPIEYLEQVGIEKIGEMVHHRFSLIKIAQVLDISSTVLRKWLQNNPEYWKEIQLAREFGAEAYTDKASEVLDNAGLTGEELKKASEIANHNRWLASKYNKEMFGNSVKVDQKVQQPVQFIFGGGLLVLNATSETMIQQTTVSQDATPLGQVIEHEPARRANDDAQSDEDMFAALLNNLQTEGVGDDDGNSGE